MTALKLFICLYINIFIYTDKKLRRQHYRNTDTQNVTGTDAVTSQREHRQLCDLM